MGRVIYFEDVDVGDELPGLSVEVTGEQVRRFASVMQLTDQRFVSEEDARGEGLPGQIVPGTLSMAVLGRLVADWGDGVRLRHFGATFRQIVRPGTPLLARGVITGKDTAAGGSFIECDLTLEDEEGERLVVGTARVSLPSRGQ